MRQPGLMLPPPYRAHRRMLGERQWWGTGHYPPTYPLLHYVTKWSALHSGKRHLQSHHWLRSEFEAILSHILKNQIMGRSGD